MHGNPELNEGDVSKGTVTINLFSQLARLVRSILYLIEEYRVVQSKTKTNRMSWLHLIFGDVHGTLICIL